MTDSIEKSFKISVADEALDLLRQKLSLARFPDELEDAGWNYGVPLSHMKRLVEFWKNGYDWRRVESELNATLPMFTRDVEVDGHGVLNIHYVHTKSKIDGAIPLLLVHGWPGSMLEFCKIIPLLLSPSTDNAPAFHVVALSLPGYGFSEAPKKTGFGPAEMGEVGHKLMLALGYDEYVCQGGDWGFAVTNHIAAAYGPKHAKAWHTNMAYSLPPKAFSEPLHYLRYLLTPYTESEKQALARQSQMDIDGRGYWVQQATKPQTLAYALADSPVGLLGWIYEKLVAWTDAYPWTDEEVLTWVSLYWFSRAGPAASLRIYFEYRMEQAALAGRKLVVNVPTGISYFPKDFQSPKTWTRSMGKIVMDAEHDRGGHFAAYEVPELFTGDLRRMFGRGGPAFGVVARNDGY
ncbi:alpha/beta-hydrolase [Peniophora sp. CONT]|nr:alpha/beta-hydrolase [Peniophora sp. CONT]